MNEIACVRLEFGKSANKECGSRSIEDSEGAAIRFDDDPADIALEVAAENFVNGPSLTSLWHLAENTINYKMHAYENTLIGRPTYLDTQLWRHIFRGSGNQVKDNFSCFQICIQTPKPPP